MCDLLVVARFHENTTWARAMAPEVLEYTKKIGNIGRESQSYLRFILEEHRSPRPNATRVCFSQGSVIGPQRSGVLVPPRAFSDDVYEPIFGTRRRWKFNSCGGPHDCLPCLFGITRSIGVALPTESNYGAFFSSTLQALRRVPIEVWWFLYNMHYSHRSCRMPFVLERLWESILRGQPRFRVLPRQDSVLGSHFIASSNCTCKRWPVFAAEP